MRRYSKVSMTLKGPVGIALLVTALLVLIHCFLPAVPMAEECRYTGFNHDNPRDKAALALSEAKNVPPIDDRRGFQTPLKGFSGELSAASDKDYGHLLLLDTIYTLSWPMHWESAEWKKFSLYMAGIGSILLLDDEIYDGVQRNRTGATSDVARVVEEFGSFPSFGIMGAFYAGGALLDNYKAKTVAMDAFAASLVSAGIIATSLKVVAGRSRPEDNEGTYRFQPFGGHHSFPSGHATQAFSLASVIAGHYDEWWIDSLAYGIAGGVGLARVEQEAHFPSDVIAGAVIGTVVGRTIVRYNKIPHKNVILEPAADMEGAWLSLKILF